MSIDRARVLAVSHCFSSSNTDTHHSPANSHVDPDTYNFVTDCNPKTWCNPDTNKCEKKTCKRDVVSHESRAAGC